MNLKTKGKGKKLPAVPLILAVLWISWAAGAAAPYAYAQEPPAPEGFRSLKVGDWWVVKIDQMALWKPLARSSWIDAGEWKFEITSIENGKMTVEVTNPRRPQGAQTWELKLVYDNAGLVVDAAYRVGDRTFTGKKALELVPLGREALSIGPSLEKLKTAPITTRFDVRAGKEVKMAAVSFARIEAFQFWRTTEPWWRYFERKKGLPVKAKLKETSWWNR